MFFLSWKTNFKLSRHLIDTSSTPSYLSSFQNFSYRNLNKSSIARWINLVSSWTHDSFSITGGSIELLFYVFASFLDTSSTASSVEVVFLDTFLDKWLDTSICRELLKLYIWGCCDPVLIFSISLNLFAPILLPNTFFSL